MGRRRAVGMIGAALIASLTGCGSGAGRTADRATEAVRDVDGVTAADLELRRAAYGTPALVGTVRLAATERARGLAVFDEAMRAVVTVAHEDGADSMLVGGLDGALASGERLDALDLAPDMPTADPRLDEVSVSAFYGKYGLS